jgi:hypothetical protein
MLEEAWLEEAGRPEALKMILAVFPRNLNLNI